MSVGLAGLRRLLGAAPPSLRLIDRFVGPLDEPLRLLFEDTAAGRVVADRHGRVVRASTTMQRMAGTALSPGTLVGTLFADADRQAVAGELAALVQGRAAALRPLTAQLLREAAAALPVSIACTPLIGDNGTVEGVLLSAQDVSLQSRLEAQLSESQRLQAAGQLAGGVAHDFNNLLTAIVGGADAIAAHGGLNDAMLEEIEAIRASAGRGAALVRHLLAFGRQQTFQPRVLALDRAVADLSAVLRRLLGNRVRLDLALEQPGELVRVDPTVLDQVLVNLSANARDAMPEGGTLTLRTGKLTLHRPLPRGPETIPAGCYVMVEVQDTGTGIPADALPHIFEPFFTTRRADGGTGLGLSTVHGIVRQCEGFVAVESAPGQGTRMRVYLPSWQGEPEPAAADAAASRPVAPRGAVMQPSLPLPTPPTPRGVILLVDDEDVVRRVAERALLRQGFRVLPAPTAELALEALRAQPSVRVAAVVTDLVMPGMDGAALVAAVRLHLGRPRLPAVLVSGYAAEEMRDKIAATPGSGETRFLAKPYDLKDLTAALSEITA